MIKFQDIYRSCKKSKIAYGDSSLIKKVYRNSIFYDGCQKNKHHDAQGFLYQDKNRLYITFRGTMDFMDTKDVIDIRHENLFSPHIKVHKGFHSQFFSIEEDITRDIKDISASYKIDELVFTGHSLGGSIALISSPYYAEQFKNKFKIKTYTFGTVSVGNKEFVDWFKQNVDEYYRIENEDDLVPHIPIHSTFHHIPNAIIVSKSGKLKFDGDSKSPGYTHILSKLMAKPTWEQIYDDHSCESYISNLMLSKRINRNFWLHL